MGEASRQQPCWVITGANSGIGYELACRLYRAGKNIVMVDKEINNLHGFGRLRVIKCDLSSRAELDELISELKQLNPEALINNAGVGFKGDFKDASIEKDLLTVNVDIVAPLLLTKNLLPGIIKNRGIIVNVASSVANVPLPGMAIYAASKSFIFQWSAALWWELRGKCDVITFSPSGTNTQFQKSAGVKENKNLLSAEMVSKEMYRAILNKTPFVFIGFRNKLFAYVIQFFPKKWQVAIWGALFKGMR